MKKRKIVRKCCQALTAKNKLCGATCQRKFCGKHQKSRRNPDSHDSHDSHEDNLQKSLDFLDQEILRIVSDHARQKLNSYRKRNPYWNRSLSAALGRQFMGDEFNEDIEPPRQLELTTQLPLFSSPIKVRRNILLIGGDSSFVPDWMDQNFDIKQIEKIRDDLERELQGFIPDLIIIFVKVTSKDTKYKMLNFSKSHDVPYISLHKGWSHLMLRATELGLDWFRSAYPHKIYIPEKDLAKLSPREIKAAKPVTKASIEHNLKRAQRFSEAGITHEHVDYAQVKYIKDESSECVLCDTEIVYQFRLLFDIPGRPQPIIFFPVGSTCITDWMNALPDSLNKAKIMIQAHEEIAKAEEIATEKKKSSGSAEASKERKKLQSQKIKELEQKRKKLQAEDKLRKRQERTQRKLDREKPKPKRIRRKKN